MTGQIWSYYMFGIQIFDSQGVQGDLTLKTAQNHFLNHEGFELQIVWDLKFA